MAEVLFQTEPFILSKNRAYTNLKNYKQGWEYPCLLRQGMRSLQKRVPRRDIFFVFTPIIKML